MKCNILIIGGGPAGIVAAVNSKKNYPSKNVVLIRENEKNIIPCGIPYIFNRLNSVKDDSVPDTSLDKNNIKHIIGKVMEIKTEKNCVYLENKQKINYEKLILATGSMPIKLPIEGAEKKGVWQIKKDFDYLKNLRKNVLKSKNVVIIGGGFIGVEIAEELSNIKGLNINIIEMMDYCLMKTFDEDFAKLAQEKLETKNVKIFTKTSVKKIVGDEKTEKVLLDNGKEILADLVIISSGVVPNTSIAKNAGIKISNSKRIIVDDYLKTNIHNIFAIGDCAEKKDFITKKSSQVMLASTACAEARIVSMNLYEQKIKNPKILGSFLTYINGFVFGATGISEEKAKIQNPEIVIGKAETDSHHPGKLPNTEKVKIKLIFSKQKKILMGAQISGPETVAGLIDLLGTVIQNKMNILEIINLEIPTHPLLTPAPTVSPIILAAQDALKNC